jgi:integrase
MARQVRSGDVRALPVKSRGPRGERWYYRFDHRGADGWRPVRDAAGWMTPDDALRACRAHDARLGGTAAVSEVRTVGAMLTAWLDWRSEDDNLRPKSVACYAQSVARIAAVVGAVDVDARTTPGSVAVLLHRAQVEAGVSHATRSLDRSVLGMAWRWLWSQRGETAPTLTFPRLGRPEKVRESRAPTADEVARVVEVLDATDPAVGDVVWALWRTGARLHELVGGMGTKPMRASAVRLPGNVVALHGRVEAVVVVGDDTKTGRREIPVPASDVSRWARIVTAARGALFGVKQDRVRRALAKACDAAGVEAFTPHALRSTMAGALVATDAAEHVAASVLGHTPEVMRRKYLRARGNERAQAVSRALEVV